MYLYLCNFYLYLCLNCVTKLVVFLQTSTKDLRNIPNQYEQNKKKMGTKYPKTRVQNKYLVMLVNIGEKYIKNCTNCPFNILLNDTAIKFMGATFYHCEKNYYILYIKLY